MVQPLRLRRATRLWLTRLDRKARDADLRVRCRVLLKVHAGQSPNRAAREIGCHSATAYRIVARFRVREEGSVCDGRWDNGTRTVGPEVLAGIVEILRATPERYGFPRPTWMLEVLARVIAEELNVTLSVGHVWKIMKQLKIRWGMPRPVVGCPWPTARRQRRLAELRRLAQHPRPRVVVCVLVGAGDPRDPRQLCHPQGGAGRAVVAPDGREDPTALPPTVLPK